MKPYFPIIFFLLTSVHALAQDSQTTIRGVVMYMRETKQTISSDGIANAHIVITNGKDSLRCVSDASGNFTGCGFPEGEAVIKVTAVGYKTYQAGFTVVKETSLVVQMEERVFDISEIVVKGDIPLIDEKGDTLLINSRVLKTMEGERAIALLKQLPGVDVDMQSGCITAFGKPVERTYLNKSLLFGENPLTAFHNLPAEEVKKMKIYDEDFYVYEVSGQLVKKKRRVIDIITFRDILNFATAHVMLNVGCDTEKDADGGHRMRYRYGATVNYFDKKRMAYANVFKNNVNDNSNAVTSGFNPVTQTGYHRIGKVEVGYEQVVPNKKMTGAFRIKAHYAYTDKYNRREDRRSVVYFPTQQYGYYVHHLTTDTEDKDKQHYVKLELSKAGKAGMVTFTHWNRFSTLHHSSQTDNRDTIDHDIRMAHILNRDQTRSYTINNQISFVLNRIMQGGITTSIANHTGETWRLDSLQSNPLTRVYTSTPIGKLTDLKAFVSIPLYTAPKWILSLNCGGSYVDTKKKQIRYALTEIKQCDSLNSYDYSQHRIDVYAELCPNWYQSVLKPLLLSLRFQSVMVNRNEQFPYSYDFNKAFHALICSASYSIQLKARQTISHPYTLSFSYRGNVRVPATEQLRTQINDSNPAYLYTGNPFLKQEYSHFVGISANLAAISLHLKANAIRNYIALQETYFADEKILPSHNGYVVPRHATLISYVNAKGYMDASLSGKYSALLKQSKIKADVALGLSYVRQPYYTAASPDYTQSLAPVLGIKFSRTFSKSLRLNLESRSGLYVCQKPAKESFSGIYTRDNG